MSRQGEEQGERPSAGEAFSFFRHADRPPLAAATGLTPGTVVGDFRLLALLGQGGMGQVWEADQLSLKRRVAVKFVRPERVTAHQLELFAREARAGGRLGHPGIVAVHGHGEAGGLAWIAMEFVGGGWTLKDFLDEVARLGEVPAHYDRHVARFVAELAEAMQTAHEAGVIHRDLKPQNVLVTADDRPKVTDFGLARIVDEAALSVSGDVAGTHFYMSPEQVLGRRMGLDHRTDVFSLGVVLYELLALRRPFLGDTSHQVTEQIVTKDPPELRTIRSKIPRDLAVIAAKALEKERDKRFQSMAELAADLRRHLAHEPIRAHEPSAYERVRKWLRRKPVESAAAAVVVTALVVITLLLLANVRANGELSRANAALSSERTNLADANRALAAKTAEAVAQRDDVLKLSALQDLEDLLAAADGLWPAHPQNIERYEAWLADARRLLAELPVHRARRDGLRAKALPQSAEQRAAERASHPRLWRLAELDGELAAAAEAAATATNEPDVRAAEGELARLEGEREALAAELDERRDWQFPEAEGEARWWNNQLTKLIAGLEALEASLRPGAPPGERGWSVARRLEFARTLAERSLTGPESRARWATALASIQDPAQCPLYAGLHLSPQLGLLPLGRDPASGLWEFAHLQTGAPAERGADGRLVPSAESGLVFVLLPGGTFTMGSQRDDPAGANYDPNGGDEEGPVHAVTLSPFFLSKYEMTQAQWVRIAGRNPSNYQSSGARDWSRTDPEPSYARHPVEQVSWKDCLELCARMELTLPSEAQWEYGARAGTTGLWWSGPDEMALGEAANLADAWCSAHGGAPGWQYERWDDGNTVHAAVGTYRANPFGLHDVLGNVWEWCLDGFDVRYAAAPTRDPLSEPTRSSKHANRGGSFDNPAVTARTSARIKSSADLTLHDLGLRPARALVP